MDDYWEQVKITEAMLRLHAPTTAQGVIDILRQHDPQVGGISGDAFYSGANAGHSLAETLEEAGWQVSQYEAPYSYILTGPDGRERLSYTEGDVSTC